MTKINIVIPMAGAGSRFKDAGFTTPKPFIDMNGRMMIEHVLDNLSYPNAHYILIAREEHLLSEPERARQILAKYDVEFITIKKLTHGAACTVLASHRVINNNTPLLIANSDQIVDINIADFINDCFSRHLLGSILTFHSNHPKWSYAKLNERMLVTEVKEKQPISTHATVGIYLFAHGSDYINGTMDMISNRDTVNEEFYVAPVYNYLIKDNMDIGIYEINDALMHGTGTPEDYNNYMQFLASKRP